MSEVTASITAALKRFWGYEGFLPLQREAMESVLAGRDSLVVLPTGGGKSLCFQAPATILPGTALVISPLIALMKDQVDALAECGIPAARLDSSLTAEEQRATLAYLHQGTIKLLYLAPERLVSPGFNQMIRRVKLSFIAVDEAHCISMWGHDFRPEYRELGSLREDFPGIALHAYTATATAHVRDDIVTQLKLKTPTVLVGSFDRPNLVYHVSRRVNLMHQVCAVLDRHKGDSGIIYCIRRADVEKMCAALSAKGYRVLPYHAGMTDEDRKHNQEAFIKEQTDTIVATIAFGMGIDKSNVRYVIHAGMPKSLEHYQQESGRAGRDRLRAECHLLYSGGDYGIWKSILTDMEPEAREIALSKLNDMYRFCTGVSCRHHTILSYFGEDAGTRGCNACDVCLGDLDCMDDALIIAQKILSCIVRLKERFGADYTALVLIGSRDQRIMQWGHDSLSTYGLLADYPKSVVRDWIEQLVAQGYIRKSEEFGTLELTDAARHVLKGLETPHLLKPAAKAAAPKPSVPSEVDRSLFDELRALRRSIADRKGVPAYIVFSDAALQDMARKKPATLAEFLTIHGVGEIKCRLYGNIFLNIIQEHSLIKR